MSNPPSRGSYGRPPHQQPQTRTAQQAPKQPDPLQPRADQPPAKRTAGSSLVRRFAVKFGIEPERMLETLKATAFRQRGKNGGPPPEITNEQMVALLTVAERYDLDPFVKQIYAFPNKAGGIEPIVPIDGWIKIIQNHPQFKDMEIYYPGEGAEMPYQWIGCRIWRKDRELPIDIREFLIECRQNTDPWNEMPTRMLRHKSIIQCGRVAFGLSGIYDPDEGARVNEAIDRGEPIDVTPRRTKPATEAPRALPAEPSQPSVPGADAPVDPATGVVLATPEQLVHIRQLLDKNGVPEGGVCEKFDLGILEDLPFDQVAGVVAWINEVAHG